MRGIIWHQMDFKTLLTAALTLGIFILGQILLFTKSKHDFLTQKLEALWTALDVLFRSSNPVGLTSVHLRAMSSDEIAAHLEERANLLIEHVSAAQTFVSLYFPDLVPRYDKICDAVERQVWVMRKFNAYGANEAAMKERMDLIMELSRTSKELIADTIRHIREHASSLTRSPTNALIDRWDNFSQQ